MKFLVIDQDRMHATMLASLLSHESHAACSASSCKDAAYLWCERQPSLVLIDPGLPDGDGLELCLQLQMNSPALILAMSVCASAQDEITFLRRGADDYLRKPFLPEQLLAHIEVLSRRSEMLTASLLGIKAVLTVGPLSVDSHRQMITLGNRRLSSTPKEIKILRFLVENRRQIVTHELLVEHVWGLGYESTDDYQLIKAYIMQIRRKLGYDCIQTFRGVGYQFVLPPQWQDLPAPGASP